MYKDLVFRVTRKQEFDQRNCVFQKLLFSLGIFFDENNVVKLVVDNALCGAIIVVSCHSLSCFLPTGELVEIRFFIFKQVVSRIFNVLNIMIEEQTM